LERLKKNDFIIPAITSNEEGAIKWWGNHHNYSLEKELNSKLTSARLASQKNWGFSAGISLDVNGNKSNTTNSSTTSNASNLVAKNIIINTDENLSTNTNVVGSNVIADENLYINTNNLNVKASQDMFTSSNDSKSLNGSISYTMYGGGGGTAGLGFGKSDSSSDSFLNNNSNLQSNNMYVNVKNDAIFQGANLKANDTLNLNVGNNLVLESLRDEYSSSHKGFNVNVGGSSSSVNGGFSMSNGVTQNKQTVLSSITGDKVNVNVGNNTHLKGSLLASGNFTEDGNFIDNKNLNFTTNTLTFGNLSNSSYSSNKSLGASANFNLSGVNDKNQDVQKGISSVGYNASNSLSINASKTLATLGQGNINIKDKENSDDLERLNTDTSKINKDLYSSSTGTKVDATLDTRLLTEDGRNQIAEDIERTKRLGQAIGDVASSDSLNIKDTFDHIDDVQKDLDVQKALALKDKGETISILENQQNYSQEQINIALNDYAQIYADVYGVNIENAKMAVLNGKYGSTYTNKDNTNSNVYLDKLNNQNALNTANTLGHEVAHVRQNQGQTYLRDTTQLQEEYANLFGNYSSSGLDFSSYVYNNVKLDSNKINSLNSINDLYALYQNSVLYKKDVAKADSGDGRIDDLTIFVHGTYSSPKDADKDFLDSVSKTYNEPVYQFDWSGKDGTENGSGADNSFWSRANAGFRLSEFIENYEFKDGETLNIIGHSHGGNVIKDLTQFYQGDKKIDNVVFMGTPVRKDYEIDYSKFSENSTIKNIYDTSDVVQILGGIYSYKSYLNNLSSLGYDSRIQDGTKNIRVESGNHPINSHSDLDSVKVWEQFNDKSINFNNKNK
ncbi:MAG: hemagglutinin repeat-containing protein, partial [Campylobacterales bacterium]|nr:hemagglutinin repeat-containing protein [Campylobacterales bacterium]